MSAVPTSFYEFLMTFDEGHRFPLMVVMIMAGTMALMFLAAVAALTVRSMYKHRLNDALKRELLDRGMSAEEIERIISVRVGSRPKLPSAGIASSKV